MKIFLLLAALVSAGRSALIDETLLYGKFPDNFIWAAATSAYQIEGAWNVGGTVDFDHFLNKLPSDWFACSKL